MTKKVLQVVLLGVFVWQLIEAIIKVVEVRPSTLITYAELDLAPLPAFTICLFPEISVFQRQGYLNRTLLEMYKKVTEEDDHDKIVSLQFANDMTDEAAFSINYRNVTALQSLGYRWDDIWSVHYTSPPMGIPLAKCTTLRIPVEVSPSPLVAVQFALNLSDGSQGILKVHEEGQRIGIFDRHLGGSSVTISAGSTGKIVALEIVKTQVITLNSRRNPCTQDDDAFFSQCVEAYVYRTMECSLPWNEGSEGTRPKRPCNTSDDFKAYNDLISSLESNKLAVTKERTGCLNKCNYTRFRVTPYTESVDPYAVKENVTHAIFGLPDPYVRVESEQPNYDANSFIGDVGGFLGLLLGLSILDIYELCKSAGTRIFRGGLREGHTPRKLAPKS